jgi:hypothetical protein
MHFVAEVKMIHEALALGFAKATEIAIQFVCTRLRFSNLLTCILLLYSNLFEAFDLSVSE